MSTPAQPRHARQRATPAAAARNRAAAAQAKQPPAPKGVWQQYRAARLARPRYQAAQARRTRRRARIGAAGGELAALRASNLLPGSDTSSRLLTAELLAGFVIVAIRALGDYQLTDGGVSKGTLNTPANGGYGPFTVLAGLIGSFFALSFLAAGGGKRAKWATAFGALIIVVLMMKSMDEIETVAGYVTASPASRTVTTAAYTAGTAQPWGAALQVASSTGLTLDAATFGGSGQTFYGAPYAPSSLTSSATASAPSAAGSGASSSAATSTGSGAGTKVVPVSSSSVTGSLPTITPG